MNLVSGPAGPPAVDPRFVAIEGPIGVGKTSLARRLSAFWQSELLLEQADDNPFLPRFYEDPARYALATQLHFLFHRSRELQAHRQGNLFAPRLVSDFLFEKDRLFARVVLDDEEYRLYHDIYQRFVLSLPRPSLVIYLQASVPTLQRRIARRGIGYEQGIDGEYLARLCREYAEFFAHYREAPVLVVNAEAINLVDDSGHFELLLAELDKGVAGRRYFNPVPQSPA